MGNRRTWFAGLATVALLVVLLVGNLPGLWPSPSLTIAQAQTPAAPAPAPVAAPTPAPGTPAPGTPAPAIAPATPVPAAMPTPISPLPTVSNTLPITGTFTDPQKRFEVGILDNMTTSTAGTSPLFSQPDGSLAYTVVTVPLSPGTADPLPDVALMQAAQKAFGMGEGFQTTGFQSVEGGGLQIGWLGRLTQAPSPAQAISGSILAKQQGGNIFLLLVAATADGAEQIPAAIATLTPTLKVL